MNTQGANFWQSRPARPLVPERHFGGPGFAREGALGQSVYAGGRRHDLRRRGTLRGGWERSPLKV